MIKTGAVILAAGTSSRMGSNKLLADLHGKPVVAHVVDAIAEAGLPPSLVVVGHEADRIITALDGRAAQPIVCDDYLSGMAHSLAAGIRAVPDDWDACIVCLADMPLIKSHHIKVLVDNVDKDSIVAPVFDGKRGNPVVWPRRFFPALLALKGDEGAKGVIKGNPDSLKLIDWPDDSIFQDGDTPEAMARLRGRC